MSIFSRRAVDRDLAGAGGARRTVMVITPYFPPEGGGLERYALNLVTRLRRDHEWNVVVVTSGRQRWGVVRENVEQVRVYRLPHQLRISNTRFGITWRRELKRIIAAEEPVLINAHAPVPGLADLAACVAGPIPLVVTYHAATMRKGRWPVDALIVFYERVFCRRLLARAAWVICSSDFVRDSYLVRFRAKCSTVTPGVDTAFFSPAAERAPGRILFVGGLGRGDVHKGLDALLSAVARLSVTRPDVRLEVVGSGNNVVRYQQTCESLGIADRVRFLGRRTGEGLLEAYREATVLALPTRNDSFPLVILEAMSCALPVVSTTVGGIPEIITQGREGFLVDPDDEHALADRLSRLLDDRETAARMGDAGRDKVERCLTWNGQVDRTKNIFASVLAGRPGEGRHRLALVTPYFYPKIGGLEGYAYQLARYLNQKPDYEVVVLTSNHEARRTVVEVVDGLTVFRLPFWLRASNTPISPWWPRQLRGVMSDNHVDIVNVHTPVPCMAEAAALACGHHPLVLTYHAGSMLKQKRAVDILIRFYEKRVLPRLLRRADALVSVSPSVASWLLAEFACRSTIVPPAVDDSVFSPPVSGQTPPSATVLFVGRIERSSAWKGIDYLLRAFALVLQDCPQARLVLVGGGDACEDHRRTAAKLGIGDRVHFRGPLSGEDLAAAYRSSSVVVLPSTTGAESFGMALIEAMACAKPVIGTRVGGIPFVINHGDDGLLVAPRDPDQLAAACRSLLENPARAAAMGKRGYEKVKAHYTWPSRVESYERIFAALASDDNRQRTPPALIGHYGAEATARRNAP